MSPTMLHYGGGTNSAAMAVGLVERGERPDLILFADTMAEKPHTYQHMLLMSDWLERRDFPRITSVRFQTRGGDPLTLEEDCLIRQSLPGIVFGFKSCSERFKIRPQNAFVRGWAPAVEAWARGEKVTKLIGYDADEERRAKPYSDARFKVRYPLIEWGWDREDCESAIRRAGLPLPGKSACFFCPSSKKAEVAELARQYPDLYARAVAMESNAAGMTSVKGLGRRWAWSDLPTWALEGKSDPEPQPEMPCGCYDGGAS